MVLFKFTNSAGIERCCDETCYDATEKDCSCVCGGTNHGKGFKYAQKRVSSILVSLIRHLKPGESVTMGNRTQQKELFE